MKNEISTLLKTSISFAIGIAGLIYLSKIDTPGEVYNPQTMRTSNYMLIDADRDCNVDAIIPNGGKPLVAPGMREYITSRDKFFDMYGISVELPKELQTSATRTLIGIQEPSLLELQLVEFRKKK